MGKQLNKQEREDDVRHFARLECQAPLRLALDEFYLRLKT